MPTAHLCAMFAKANFKLSRPVELGDFIPGYKPPRKKKQTPEEMLTVVKFLNAAFGGKVVEH